MDEPSVTIRVIVSGRVQGVWYRGWAVDEARDRGLSGWVRNRRDGSVEALFSGPEAQVRAMIERCREGPPAARVDGLAETRESERPEGGFRQLPTA